MPQPEEVDEINEFLLKRREKQRMGELPREDYTPGFAKKISSAIFGKPRVEEKPLLKSTQPTYASSQAQAAMRQQLDEIMESRPIRTAYAAPAPKNAAQTPLAKSAPASPSVSPKPAVPNYYTNMPYPPYIQRGLATLDKKSPTAAKMAGLSSAPRAPAPSSPAAPRTTVSPNAMKPAAWPATTPKTIERMTPAPAVRTNASAPLPSTNSTAPTSPLPKPISPAATSASAYGAKPFTPTQPAKTSNTIPTPVSAASATKKESIPFWKKLFAKKENTTVSPATSGVPPVSPLEKRPIPYYAAPPARATEYKPLESIAPAPATRETSAAATVPRAVAPVSSTPEKKSPAPTTNLLPATTPSVPMVQSSKPQTEEKKSQSPAPTTYTSTRPTTPVQRADISAARPPAPASPRTPPVQPEIKSFTPEKKNPPTNVSASSSAPSSAPAQPYTPPWVARATPRDATASTPTPSPAGTLPWRQPFGTDSHSTETLEKNAPTSAPASGTTPKAIPRAIDEERVTRPKEHASQEIDVRELEKPATRDAALDEEISEEEALEKLPFEDVEGLSASDLDYLSKKEKEHRQAQEEKENDLGIPSELRDTLQRQSSQLQGALQPGNAPTNDEKQEILRRLKKMMEDEGHS